MQRLRANVALHLPKGNAGVTGQDLAKQPAVAEQLQKACQALRTHVLNPQNVSALTGRLKRRVVLD